MVTEAFSSNLPSSGEDAGFSGLALGLSLSFRQ